MRVSDTPTWPSNILSVHGLVQFPHLGGQHLGPLPSLRCTEAGAPTTFPKLEPIMYPTITLMKGLAWMWKADRWESNAHMIEWGGNAHRGKRDRQWPQEEHK